MQLSAQLECQRHIAIVTQWSARTYATHGSLTADDGQRVGNHWRSALLRVSGFVYVCLLCIMAVSWTWHIFQSPMLADRPNQPNKGGGDIGIKIERETLIHKQSTQICCHWLWTREKKVVKTISSPFISFIVSPIAGPLASTHCVVIFILLYYIFIRIFVIIIIMPNSYSVSGPSVYNDNSNKIVMPGEMNAYRSLTLRRTTLRTRKNCIE